MAQPAYARIALRVVLAAIVFSSLAVVAPSDAAARRHGLVPSPFLYRYDGVVYDRVFSLNAYPRFSQRPMLRASSGRPALPGTPYALTNLAAVFTGSDGPLSGFPTAINDAGLITFYDECGCFGDPYDGGNAGIVTDDHGDEISQLTSQCCAEGTNDAVPYALNTVGNSAGEYGYTVGGTDSFSGNITWSLYGSTIYFDGADNGSATYAINDDNVAVGVDVGPKGIFAGAYSLAPDGLMRRVLLAPPKNTAWTGVATGVDDAGEIVGYATFGNGNGRAVRFYENGYAQVLPVGAPGVSTSAQAINVHGDVVGNAGSQAFLYKDNRVTYLPRPPGETAGNAVAYAIDASDDIVGNIITKTHQTAFLYVAGRSYDLDSLLPLHSGWTVNSAVGINDAGQIVGSASTASDPYGSFGFSMKPRSTR